jgi:uncharacterized membrane protein
LIGNFTGNLFAGQMTAALIISYLFRRFMIAAGVIAMDLTTIEVMPALVYNVRLVDLL